MNLETIQFRSDQSNQAQKVAFNVHLFKSLIKHWCDCLYLQGAFSRAVVVKLPTLYLDDDCHSVLRQEESELNFFCHT